MRYVIQRTNSKSENASSFFSRISTQACKVLCDISTNSRLNLMVSSTTLYSAIHEYTYTQVKRYNGEFRYRLSVSFYGRGRGRIVLKSCGNKWVPSIFSIFWRYYLQVLGGTLGFVWFDVITKVAIPNRWDPLNGRPHICPVCHEWTRKFSVEVHLWVLMKYGSPNAWVVMISMIVLCSYHTHTPWSHSLVYGCLYMYLIEQSSFIMLSIAMRKPKYWVSDGRSKSGQKFEKRRGGPD